MQLILIIKRMEYFVAFHRENSLKLLFLRPLDWPSTASCTTLLVVLMEQCRTVRFIWSSLAAFRIILVRVKPCLVIMGMFNMLLRIIWYWYSPSKSLIGTIHWLAWTTAVTQPGSAPSTSRMRDHKPRPWKPWLIELRRLGMRVNGTMLPRTRIFIRYPWPNNSSGDLTFSSSNSLSGSVVRLLIFSLRFCFGHFHYLVEKD